jgi:ABC-2 type transport system ATP-binding protein
MSRAGAKVLNSRVDSPWCTAVGLAVMSGGRIVAQGTPAQLVRDQGGQTRVHLEVPAGFEMPDLSMIKGVDEVRVRDGSMEVLGRGPFLAGLGHALVECGLDDIELDVRQPSLEDAYVGLVNR